MDVYPGSRNKSRNPSILVATATGLALAAIGWAVGLIPGSDDERFSVESAPPSESAPASGTAESLANGTLGGAPEGVIADCNRFAAEVQGASADVGAGAAMEGAAGVGADTAGAVAGDAEDGATRGASVDGATSASAAALYGLRPENARTESARSAYRNCMLEHGFSG